MATTIITKNGSGAPVAGDLVQGELAVDLTNKTLYSKDSSGNVFKVGDTGGGSPGTFTDLVATDSFTSPGIDDNATSTAITIDANGDVGIGTNVPSTSLDIIRNGVMPLRVESTSGNRVSMRLANTGGNAFVEAVDSNIVFPSGNVGIGTDTPANPHIVIATNTNVLIEGEGISATGIAFETNNTTRASIGVANASADLSFFSDAGSTETMRIDSSGNVGIGTSDPTAPLEVNVTGAGDAFKLTRDTGTTGELNIDFSGANANFSSTQGGYSFSTASASPAMAINSAGNVGIGINPAAILHVHNPSASCSPILSSGTGAVYLSMRGANGVHQVQYGDGITDASYSFYDNKASTERMRIDASGTTTVTGGFEAAQPGAGAGAFAAGDSAGITNQGNYATAVGRFAGNSNQGNSTVAIGNTAGQASQSNDAVAVGKSAGESSQGGSSVAVGPNAGNDTQGANAVAIGKDAGKTTQSTSAVAIGQSAGN